MASILKELYSQIAVLELLELISRCGNAWYGYDQNTYTTTLQMQNGTYDFYLAAHPETNNYILDIVLNGTYYTSISSSDQPELADLYSEIVDIFDYHKERSLVADLSALQRCPVAQNNVPITIQGGSGSGGAASVKMVYNVTRSVANGVRANGGSSGVYNYDIIPTGVSISGQADSEIIGLIDFEFEIASDIGHPLTDYSFRFFTIMSPFSTGVPDSSSPPDSTPPSITGWFTPTTTDPEDFKALATNVLYGSGPTSWTPESLFGDEISDMISFVNDTDNSVFRYLYKITLTENAFNNYDYIADGTFRLLMEFRLTSEVGDADPTIGGVVGTITV